MYKYLCEGGGVTQIFFVFQDLKICTSFFDVQIFYLCFVRGLCTFRFHPIGIHQRNPSEEKINTNADGGLYNRRAIFRIGPTTDVDHNACCGSFSHVQTVIVISSAGWEQRQPASFQKSAIAGAIPLEEHCFNCRYPIEH